MGSSTEGERERDEEEEEEEEEECTIQADQCYRRMEYWSNMSIKHFVHKGK